MRRLMLMFLLMFGVALVFSGDAWAKGGKGGGGGGRHRVSGGHGGQQRSVKHQRKLERQGGQTRQIADAGDKPDHRKEKPLKEKPAKERKVKNSDETIAPGDDDVASPDTEIANKKQKQLEIAQRQRDKRIAQAQHLREIAERNGNANLAANADRMEASAHDHYARRVAHWEKFGVTDPTLNPGDGTTDPLLPDGDDPLLPDGDDGVLDPVGDVLGSFLPRLP